MRTDDHHGSEALFAVVNAPAAQGVIGDASPVVQEEHPFFFSFFTHTRHSGLLSLQWYIGLSGEILPIDDEVQEDVKKVVTTNPQLIDFHKVKSSGDAFLIATAMKYGLTVITEESKKGEKKIPFVCQNLHVPCVDILGLCEKEGWSF